MSNDGKQSDGPYRDALVVYEGRIAALTAENNRLHEKLAKHRENRAWVRRHMARHYGALSLLTAATYAFVVGLQLTPGAVWPTAHPLAAIGSFAIVFGLSMLLRKGR